MAKKKRHYTRAQREALRLKAEAERRPDNHQVFGPLPRLRSQRKKPAPFVAPGGPLRSHRLDPDRLIAGVGFKLGAQMRARLQSVLVAALAHRPGLADEPYRSGLVSLIWGPWQQQPGSWQPAGKGLNAAYRSLLAHVLGPYHLSPNLWDMTLADTGGQKRPKRQAICFVAHLARGESPRRLVGTDLLPAPLTRRMLHLLTNPPRPLPLVPAVRRAQVLAHGGTEALARCFEDGFLSLFRRDEDYWATVIHWLCRQPDLEFADIRPFLDFLARRAAAGSPVLLRGRNVASVRRLVREWHDELAQINGFTHRQFQRSGFGPGVWSTHRKEDGVAVPFEHWSMAEILTAKDLVTEGRTMRHCVASYRAAVANQRTSIWSLTCNDQRRLTLEVDNRQRAIVQVRGRANRLPRIGEVRFIRSWARQNRLAVQAGEVKKVLGEI